MPVGHAPTVHVVILLAVAACPRTIGFRTEETAYPAVVPSVCLRSGTVGNSCRVSCPGDDRNTVCNRSQAFEIKDITLTTRLHLDVGNPDEDGRHKLVGKQEMVVCGGAECGSGRRRLLHRQLQLDGAAGNVGCRDGRHAERQFLARSFIIRVYGVEQRRPVRRDCCIYLKSAGHLGCYLQHLLHQLRPVVGTPSVDACVLVLVTYAVGHDHRHLHAAETLCRKFRNLFLDIVVVILTSRGIRKPHTCHGLCMGIRGKEALDDSSAIMNSLAERWPRAQRCHNH